MSASALDRAIEGDDLDQVKRLVTSGANLEEMGDYDGTPLANAAALGRTEIVRYLLEAGADPALGGCRPVLGNACGRGHYDVCKLLLDAGADPNEAEEVGSTCLHLAIHRARLDVIKLLIEQGANAQPLDEYLAYAASRNVSGSHDQVLEYLMTLRTKSG